MGSKDEVNLLNGIRVLDLTRLLPGGYATNILSELGAEVIKIEDTGAGDYLRDLGPSFRDYQKFSSYFTAINYNKKSLSINLKEEDGKRIFEKLAKDADIIIESFRPGIVKKLGVDYESIKKLNPSIIYCSISAYGQKGTRANYSGHDINLLSMSGFLDVNGEDENSQPVIPGTQLVDLGTGMSSILGILIALFNRERTGKGEYVEISMYDFISSWLIGPYLDYLATGKINKKGSELLSGGVLCYNVYETQDKRYLAFGAVEDKFWKEICKVLNLLDLEDKAFSPANDDNPFYVKLKNQIKMKTLSEWMTIFDHHDCCVTPVLNIKEAINDSHFSSRNMIETIEAKNIKLSKIRLPFNLVNHSQTISDTREFNLPPEKGEHSRELLEDLGFDEDEIKRFIEKGIVFTP